MYSNYLVNRKKARLTEGHLKANELYKKILEHDGSEAYCCYFDLETKNLKLEYHDGTFQTAKTKTGVEYKKKNYLYYNQTDDDKPQGFGEPQRTFTDYEGQAKPSLNMVSFDFDGDDLEVVKADVQRFCEWFAVDDIVVFFSGSKGFHVMVPWGYFPFEIGISLPLQLKDMAKELKEHYPSLDTSIYNYNRKFRVPFSKHDKSGLYKNVIDLDMLISDIEYIKASCELPDNFDFLEYIKPNQARDPLDILIELADTVKRKSYEVNKDVAGTKEAPTQFEKFDQKLCIRKMLDSTCGDVGRNNACIRIVNDMYRTGKPQNDCEIAMQKWSKTVQLPYNEIQTIIENIYNGRANYNFGCQDDIKATYCSAKCHIWKRLAPDKRPVTIDMPTTTSTQGKLKNDFEGVTWLMEKVFGSNWNEVNKAFDAGSIIKQGGSDLFYYKNGYWQYLEKEKIHTLKQKLNAKFENALSLKKLTAIFDLLIISVPNKPNDVDLFSPRSDAANFSDGTLHMVRDGGSYDLIFKPHDKLDYMTTMINEKYQSFVDDGNNLNGEFEAWLLDCLEGDKARFNQIQEMFGASLLPDFPQFFILLGASGTGKSTTMKILKKLHGTSKHICGVSPDKFNGFHMHSMVGSLINIVMDVKTNCRIDDDMIKSVDDKEPMRIERKRLDDIYAPLPPLHIFGANKMPTTMEGYSGAFKRRFSIVNFDKAFTGTQNKYISNDLYNSNPQGILNFALHGLMRLVKDNGGNYTVNEKSQESVEKWTKEKDVIYNFLEDMEYEGMHYIDRPLRLVPDKSLRIKRSFLWELFKKWQNNDVVTRFQISKHAFFAMVCERSFKLIKSNGVFYFVGLGESLGENESV